MSDGFTAEEMAREQLGYLKAMEELETKIDRLKALLKKVEWKGSHGMLLDDVACVLCSKPKNHGGHAEGCELAKELKE